MRLRLEGYAAAQRSLSRRALVLGLLGAVLAVWGGFWVVVFVAHAATQRKPTDSVGLEIAAGLILGVAPLAGGIYMLLRALVARRRLARLRRLAAAAWSGATLTRDAVAHASSVSPAEATAMLLDAAELGALEDQPGGALVTGPSAAGAATPAPMTASGTRPTADNLLGQVLGSYRVERFIAAGGMGAVYGARHVRTGRWYALKVLLVDARGSTEAIQRFEREATAVGSLGHPGIVAVHDFDTAPNGLRYLVMDLLDGETLEQRLARSGSLPWRAAVDLVRAVASALSAAHDRGFIHRDLKPSNVFLARYADGTERAVLLDFGLAKSLDAAAAKVTATGAAAGTPLYMSPEQARGEPVDVRADVYGLGALAYETITGAPPFHDVTLAKVYARLLHDSVAPAASFAACPPALDAVIQRALAKSAADRYPDVRSFLAALEAAERGPALAATQPG